ncbi:MAG: hypothetical protein KAZ88_04385 [Acidimicrobiia bacterium]|nr:hypothetical protein [Acidimicrobiia bacterium]MBP8180211.1 hypothetical protein [Acidimicrobiia bacterium]
MSKRARLLARGMLVVLLVLGCAEGASRWLLERAGSTGSEQERDLDQVLFRYEALAARADPWDVLIVGDSTAAAAIAPRVWPSKSRPLAVFNGSLRGAQLTTQVDWLERLGDAGVRTQVMLIGVSELTLLSGTTVPDEQRAELSSYHLDQALGERGAAGFVESRSTLVSERERLRSPFELVSSIQESARSHTTASTARPFGRSSNLDGKDSARFVVPDPIQDMADGQSRFAPSYSPDSELRERAVRSLAGSRTLASAPGELADLLDAADQISEHVVVVQIPVHSILSEEIDNRGRVSYNQRMQMLSAAAFKAGDRYIAADDVVTDRPLQFSGLVHMSEGSSLAFTAALGPIVNESLAG